MTHGDRSDVSSASEDGGLQRDGYGEAESRGIRLQIARSLRRAPVPLPPMSLNGLVARVRLVREAGDWQPPVLEAGSGDGAFDLYALSMLRQALQLGVHASGDGWLIVPVGQLVP